MRTAPPPTRETQAPPADTDVSARWTRRAWLMLPTLAVALVVSSVLGVWFMHLLGLPEGALLLMAGGAGAWAAELLVTLILVAPPVAGITFAALALRRGAPGRTWVPLTLHALVVAWVLYTFVDDIRMSYFPG